MVPGAPIRGQVHGGEKIIASLLENGDLSARKIGLIARRDPVEVRLRNRETAVLHAQRLEDALMHEGRKRHAGNASNENAEDLGAHVIQPALARLMRERQAGETIHEFVGSTRERECAQRQTGFDEGSVKRTHRRQERYFAVP